MKKLTCMIAGCLLASASFAADGYYATKADERAGRLTPGTPPQSVVNAPNVGTDACPGLTIADPGAATFNDTGTTIGANNTVNTLQAGCSDYTQVAGPDVVYQFDLGPVGTRGTPLTIVSSATSGTYDNAIYTLSTAGGGCPAGISNVVTNCVNGADAAFGASGTETITDTETDAMAAGHYFLFIDSFYTDARGSGTYTLAIGTGPFPVELVEFGVE